MTEKRRQNLAKCNSVSLQSPKLNESMKLLRSKRPRIIFGKIILIIGSKMVFWKSLIPCSP